MHYNGIWLRFMEYMGETKAGPGAAIDKYPLPTHVPTRVAQCSDTSARRQVNLACNICAAMKHGSLQRRKANANPNAYKQQTEWPHILNGIQHQLKRQSLVYRRQDNCQYIYAERTCILTASSCNHCVATAQTIDGSGTELLEAVWLPGIAEQLP